MSNQPNGSASPTPIHLSADTSYLVKPPMPTELALTVFNTQRCVHWSVERLGNVSPWWGSTQIAFYINCSYVMVLFGHYDPEYTPI